MENALLLLKSTERERFGAKCMTPEIFCSREEVADFIWHTEHVKSIGEVSESNLSGGRERERRH